MFSNAMAAVARTTGPLGIAIRTLFENIGRLTTYAATFAALMAGRWVAGLVAAAVSVRGLATALVLLRGALIRTGIGALIVGAGELIYQFGRLVTGAGGFGNAMSLLGDVAAEVWERIRMGAAAAGAAATAMFFDLKADAASAMQGAIGSVVGFGNTAVNTFEGAYEAIKAIWGLLPAAIGDLAFQAANSLVDGVEAMLNGVVSRINGFIGGINAGLEALGSERRISLVPDLDLGRIGNRFEGAASTAATAAKDAFERAFADNPLTAPDLGLAGVADQAAASAETWRQAAATLAESARQPLAALAALRDAVNATGTEAESALGSAAVAAEAFDAALTKGGAGGASGPAAALHATAAAAGRAGGALETAADVARRSWDAARAALERTKEVARGLAEDITGPLKDALKAGELSWRSFAGAVAGIARNLADRLITGVFKRIEDAIVGLLGKALSGGGGTGGDIFGSLLGAVGSALGGLVGGGGPTMAPAPLFSGIYARGGVFDRAGEVTAFARGGVIGGGVVTRPTIFPFARGIGLMGEAGPEAILPLRRGPGGRLGVEAGGAREAPAPVTRIINVLDPAILGDYLATPAGERAIVNVIRRNRSALDA
jgi:hypothetical protein